MSPSCAYDVRPLQENNSETTSSATPIQADIDEGSYESLYDYVI